MKCVLMAWGQLKRGCEVLALCEMFSQGMREVEKGGVSCWHCVKHVFEGMGAVETGV